MNVHSPDLAVEPPAERRDLELIASLVPTGARVLDVGCGDGTLLATLREEKHVDGRGIDCRGRLAEASRRT